MHYFPLFAADMIDLTDTYFNMYVRQLPRREASWRFRPGGVTGTPVIVNGCVRTPTQCCEVPSSFIGI